jgi:hypothetical protein
MIRGIIGKLKRSFFDAQYSKLFTDWKKFKLLIEQSLNNNDISVSFGLLEGIGYFGYKYNFLENFTDADIEKYIVQLSDHFPKLSAFPADNNRVAFYDFFTWDNRGFTQQYLKVIIDKGYELLYVTFNEDAIFNQIEIIRTLKNYSKATIFCIPSNLKREQQLTLIAGEIEKFRPSKLFFHVSPWDILSCCLAKCIKASSSHSYLINITDHTYWPGASLFDYVIDFREYGYMVNKFYRKIEPTRLFIIPTPPHLNTNAAFKGFPVDITGKVVGFSGGALYKIFDEKHTFLNLITRLLNENPDFVFLFANVGEYSFLNEFIKKNKLENRFVLIGNRSDINEVFKRIDIYFNTYPYGGGLMLQYSILNHKPIIALNDPQLLYTRIDKVIDKSISQQFIVADEKAYVQLANKIIRDPSTRQKLALELSDTYDVQEIFEERLCDLLEGQPASNQDIKFISIESRAIAQFHINSDNLFSREYLFLKHKYFKSYPILKRIIEITVPYILYRLVKKAKLI